jgi:restriction endonuclease
VKEDVLEQIADDYLQFEGYFTIHNVRLRPRPDHPEYRATDDSVPSDVDIVGYHPGVRGRSRVVVVSCKSWQGGFDATAKLAELRGEKRTRRGRRGGTSASSGSRSGAKRFARRSRSGLARATSIIGSQ